MQQMVGKASSVSGMTGRINTSSSMTGQITKENQRASGTINIPTGGGEYTPNPYDGDYTIIPKAYSDVVLDTNGKTMFDDVTVKQVPYYETSNEFGETVYIASEV